MDPKTLQFLKLVKPHAKFSDIKEYLKESDEFNGLFVTPKIGINIIYNVTEDVGLSGGIHFSKALSMRGEIEGEKLQFNNSVLSFGVIVQAF